MSWEYSQSTGRLTHNDQEIQTRYSYSGFGAGRNNPAMQGTRDVGPIPRGRYRIGTPYRNPHTGPHSIRLSPIGHNALGRTGLHIHGESSRHPGRASTGCIILPPDIRQRISDSGDDILIVTE